MDSSPLTAETDTSMKMRKLNTYLLCDKFEDLMVLDYLQMRSDKEFMSKISENEAVIFSQIIN